MNTLPTDILIDLVQYFTHSQDVASIHGTFLWPIWKRHATRLDFRNGQSYFTDDYSVKMSRPSSRWSEIRPLISAGRALKVISLPFMEFDYKLEADREHVHSILLDTRYRDVCLYIADKSKLIELSLEPLVNRVKVYGSNFTVVVKIASPQIETPLLYDRGIMNLFDLKKSEIPTLKRLNIPVRGVINPRGGDLSCLDLEEIIITGSPERELESWLYDFPTTIKAIRCRCPLKWRKSHFLDDIPDDICFPHVTIMELPVDMESLGLKEMFPSVKKFDPLEFIHYRIAKEKLSKAKQKIARLRRSLTIDYPHLLEDVS